MKSRALREVLKCRSVSKQRMSHGREYVIVCLDPYILLILI